MKKRNWAVWVLLFVFGFAVLSGGCGGVDDDDKDPAEEPKTLFEDAWDVPTGPVSDATAVIENTEYSLELLAGGTVELVLDDPDSADSANFASPSDDDPAPLTGKVNVELKWKATYGSKNHTFTTKIEDDDAEFSADVSGVYMYTAEDPATTVKFSLNDDASLSVFVEGAAKTIEEEHDITYKAGFRASGFFAALRGVWTGSNGKASGTDDDDVQVTATLAKGTACVIIGNVTVKSADAWVRIRGEYDSDPYAYDASESAWIIEGGRYDGEEVDMIFGPAGGDEECYVWVERPAMNEFRIMYDWTDEDGGGLETMEITLDKNDKTKGKLTFMRERRENGKYIEEVSGGFDIEKLEL